MAEACGNRTHRPRLAPRATGFEVQEAHQHLFASIRIVVHVFINGQPRVLYPLRSSSRKPLSIRVRVESCSLSMDEIAMFKDSYSPTVYSNTPADQNPIASIGMACSKKSLTNKFFLCYISSCTCVVPYVCFLHRAVTRVGTTADERRDRIFGASHPGGCQAGWSSTALRSPAP